jgi:hypothetical protein
MKLTNKIAIISGLGCLALVGTGYAAWTFNAEASNSAEQANVLAAAQTVGEVKIITQTAKITLDEKYTAYVDKTNNTPELSNNKIQGKVTWDGDLSADYVGTAESTKVNRKWTASIGAGLSTYIQFASGAAYTNVEWIDNTPITLPALEFIADKAPQNMTEYSAMSAAINGKTITFTFVATPAVA